MKNGSEITMNTEPSMKGVMLEEVSIRIGRMHKIEKNYLTKTVKFACADRTATPCIPAALSPHKYTVFYEICLPSRCFAGMERGMG